MVCWVKLIGRLLVWKKRTIIASHFLLLANAQPRMDCPRSDPRLREMLPKLNLPLRCICIKSMLVASALEIQELLLVQDSAYVRNPYKNAYRLTISLNLKVWLPKNEVLQPTLRA
jgi:hypothetical protein